MIMAKKNGIADVLVILSIIIFAILVLPKLFATLGKALRGSGSASGGSASKADTGVGAAFKSLSDQIKQALSGNKGGGSAGQIGGGASRAGNVPNATNVLPSLAPFIPAGPSYSDLRPWEFVPIVAPQSTFSQTDLTQSQGGVLDFILGTNPTDNFVLASPDIADLPLMGGGDLIGSLLDYNPVMPSPDISDLGFDTNIGALQNENPEISSVDTSGLDGSVWDSVSTWLESSFSSVPEFSDSGAVDTGESPQDYANYYLFGEMDAIDAYEMGGGDQNFYY
jgi:hypothetical protein